jgi:hypothetical protein
MDEATLLLDFEIVSGAALLLLVTLIYLFYFKFPVNKDLGQK